MSATWDVLVSSLINGLEIYAVILCLGSWVCDFFDGQVMIGHGKSVYGKWSVWLRLVLCASLLLEGDGETEMFMTYLWKGENLSHNITCWILNAHNEENITWSVLLRESVGKCATFLRCPATSVIC